MADQGNAIDVNEEQALHKFLTAQNNDMLRNGLPPVSTATALKFLMARTFDVTRAKRLFERHLEVRQKYKMAAIKPLDEPLSKELLTEKFTFLSRHRENKPTVILLNGRNYKSEKSQNITVIQSLIFQLDEALRDTSTQRHGLILIYNMTNSGRQNFDYSLSLEILNLLKDAYPAKLKKILIVSAPIWFRVSFKIISTFLNEKIRERVQFSDTEEIQQHLEAECIPRELGGKWMVDHGLWLTRCIESYKEGNCDEPCFQILQTTGASIKTTLGRTNRVPRLDSPVIPTELKDKIKDKIPPGGLTVRELLEHMRERGPHGLKKEFDTIATFDRTSTYDVFKFPYNRRKNRYVDVICLDHSRVRIPITDGDEATDYIHANYIDGYHMKNAYIAAQGPLPATYGDFWRMVWSTKTVIIIMLTKEIQRGRVKCGRYWPDKGTFEQYEDIEISCVEEIVKDDLITREFVVTDIKTMETRNINHIQMISWPDFGVPDSAEPIFQLKARVEDLQSETADPRTADSTSGETTRPPVVVHCSAGIGRTGSYCTVSIGIDSLLDTGHCDVMNAVTRIRGQRALSVQTADQYEFCYTSLLEYAALHVDSIEPEEKIEILDFLNDWKKSQMEKELVW